MRRIGRQGQAWDQSLISDWRDEWNIIRAFNFLWTSYVGVHKTAGSFKAINAMGCINSQKLLTGFTDWILILVGRKGAEKV
jgi:hypothetical protein